jgi:hypothetical protein
MLFKHALLEACLSGCAGHIDTSQVGGGGVRLMLAVGQLSCAWLTVKPAM